MGKRTKLRAAQRLAAEQVLAARLRNHVRIRRQRKRRHADCIITYWQFPIHAHALIRAYCEFALHAPENWSCTTKDPSVQQRFLNLVQFTFFCFRVARHLEQAWLPIPAEYDPRWRDHWPDFRRCYIVATQGGSVYRECLRLTLSRREVHHFLTAPPQVATSQRALWYAIARVHTDDVALAVSISQTTLDRCPVTSSWREVARFFAHNPTSISEMNHIIEYVTLAEFYTPGFSLAGRTLASLRERLEEWRTLGEYAFCMRARWSGSALPDGRYEYVGAVWHLRQIRTGADLAHEGKLMRHCVHTYLQACMRGHCSIWSLAREGAGSLIHAVTCELRGNAIVQCRGFANSAPGEEALTIAKAWAAESGLSWAAD